MHTVRSLAKYFLGTMGRVIRHIFKAKYLEGNGIRLTAGIYYTPFPLGYGSENDKGVFVSYQVFRNGDTCYSKGTTKFRDNTKCEISLVLRATIEF